MSSNIHIPYYLVANTIYTIIRDDDGKVWNTSTKSFETWSDSNIANYVINATSKGGSLYIAGFPVDAASAYYTIFVFLQSGASPNVSSDIWIGTSSSYWDKSAQTLEVIKASGAGAITTIERAPKVQVEAEKVVDSTDIPPNVEVLPTGIQRTSTAKSGQLVRKTIYEIGP